MKRPEASEHAEYYAAYIDEVPDRPLTEVLREAPDALAALMSGLSADREAYAYEPGKWTIREVLGHVIDTERLFAYRALHMARSDPAELPGVEQDDWAASSNSTGRTVADLLAEFRALRTALHSRRRVTRRALRLEQRRTVRFLRSDRRGGAQQKHQDQRAESRLHLLSVGHKLGGRKGDCRIGIT